MTIPKGWTARRLADCLAPLSLDGRLKIQTRDYRPSGRFPIIDQGRNEIAGWTDNEAAAIHEHLPLIVFGDHTRAFKLADVPFARGADGTQLLKPKPGIDPLFFFYACRSIPLSSRGYNRHFSLLKEKEIIVPCDRKEQRALGEALHRVERSVIHQNAMIDVSRHLKRAAMRTLFTRGLRGETSKETELGPVPESWNIFQLQELCSIRSGGTPPKSQPEHWKGNFPWASGKDLKANRFGDTIDHITLDAARNYSTIAPAGSVLVLVRGMALANGLPLALVECPMAFNQDVKALEPGPALKSDFLMHMLTFSADRLLRNISNAAHGTKRLGHTDLSTFQIPLPGDEEQKEIAAILNTIDRKSELHREKQAVLEKLFQSLLHKLMTGEIRVDQLDLSALNSVEEP